MHVKLKLHECQNFYSFFSSDSVEFWTGVVKES